MDSEGCPACGDGREEDAPLGTWSGTGEANSTAEADEPPRASAADSVTRSGRARENALPPALPSARRGRGAADLTPLPSSSLAIAQRPGLSPSEETRARRREAEVLDLRRPTPEPHEPKPAASRAQPEPIDGASGERARPEVVRPPLLASDLLREHLDPTEPGARSLRVFGILFGLVGALLASLGGGLGPFAIVTASLLLAVATVSALRLRYSTRAGALLTLGLLGMGLADWPRLRAGAGPEELLLSLATLFLAGFLLLRAYHRASRLARTGVVISVMAMLLWLILTLPEAGLGLASGDWAASLIAFFRFCLLIFVFLSMLAFLPSTSRGGCHIWAYGLAVLYGGRAIYLALQLELPSAMAAALIVGAVSVVLGAMSLAQVLATIRTRGLKA